MGTPPNERAALRRLIARLDNGEDLQFLPTDPGGTVFDMPTDAAEVFISRGVAPAAGTWFGWDRVGDENAFAAGTLVAPLSLWASGDLDRLLGLLRAALPADYTLTSQDGAIVISREPTAAELALPELADERAVIVRIGIIAESRPGSGGFTEDEFEEIVAERAKWQQTPAVRWLQEVMASATPKAKIAALRVAQPVTEQAVTGLLAELKTLTKGWMEVDTLLHAMAQIDDPRLDATIDELAAMRGALPRGSAAQMMGKRRSDAAAEALVWKWMIAKRKYPSTEPITGATQAVIRIRARRLGRPVLEIARQLRDDPGLDEFVRGSIDREIGYLERQPGHQYED